MDEKFKWEQAMQSKFDFIAKNQAWDLVSLPPNNKDLPYE